MRCLSVSLPIADHLLLLFDFLVFSVAWLKVLPWIVLSQAQVG
jgi:hypothetical protein